MSRVRVKVCGITRPEDALVAVGAGADAIGLVFAESPRQVTPEQAAAIVRVLPPWVAPVGVFVNTDPGAVLQLAREVRLGAVQLHGEESPAEVAELCGMVPVIKGYRIGNEADAAEAAEHAREARPTGCLVDARSSKARGGTGEMAPWDVVAAHRKALWPLVLAGGLRPENVAQAIAAVQPFAVDASSGVESKPGRKDPERVAAFVANAMSATTDYPRDGEDE